MIELTTQEIMLLIDLASKACMIPPVTIENWVDGAQFSASQNRVMSLFAKLDREYPGLMPVPHDGVEWKNRM